MILSMKIRCPIVLNVMTFKVKTNQLFICTYYYKHCGYNQ